MSIFREMDLHQRVALGDRKEPGRPRDLAGQPRSKLAAAMSAATVGDKDWEWYIILSLGILLRKDFLKLGDRCIGLRARLRCIRGCTVSRGT
jgi:hypothetical protein